MARRLQKTLADYMVIAISPALIMALVMSLVFFLLEICYTGQFEWRVRWILFWFVFAAVLTARIGIEQGSGYAAGYTLAMAAAAGLVVMRYVDAVLLTWILFAVIWWSASKLTWDCTLIDEDEDASGEGLLQAAGLDVNRTNENGPQPETANAAQPSKAEGEKSAEQETADRPPLWERLFLNRAERKGRAHAPGLWVVYFSLAALPLFGIGQLMLDKDDAASRRFGFMLLWIYVASALGLLLTTSFLGLRRYLRQRKLRMPASMAAAWLGTGATLILVILVLSVFLPRPQSDYSINGLVDRIGTAAQRASKYALLRHDAGTGKGAASSDRKDSQDAEDTGKGAAEPKSSNPGSNAKKPGTTSGEQRDKQASRNSDAGRNGNNEEKSGQSKASGKRDESSDGKRSEKGNDSKGGKSRQSRESSKDSKDGQQSAKSNDREASKQNGKENQRPRGEGTKERTAKGEKDSGRSARSSPSTPSTAADWVGRGVKWLIYGVLGLGALFVLVRYGDRIAWFLGQLWLELMKLWNDLFGRRRDKTATKDGDPVGETATPRRPFADYPNPFFSAAASRLSPEELLRYTFEALEAWAEDQGTGRHPDQTPHEFAHSVGMGFPSLKRDVQRVTGHYAQVAYANRHPSHECRDDVESLWRKLGEPVSNLAEPQAVSAAPIQP